MKILNQQLELLDSIHAIPLNKSVLITDSTELTQLAKKEGLDVIKLTVSDLVNSPNWQNQITHKLKDKEIVVNALGYHTDPTSVDFGLVKLFGDAYLILLKSLKAMPQHLTLISLSFSCPFLTALMDGLAKSLSKETTRLSYKSLSVSLPSNLPLKEILGSCLSHPGDRILLNGSHFYRSTFLPVSTAEKINSIKLKIGGIYVITGGGGGVGRALCEYLVKNYKACVFLIGRKDLNDTFAKQLKEAGAKSYLKADVSDLNSLSSAIQHIESTVPKIDGLFHLAGTLSDALFDNITNVQLHQALKPKVAGLLNLAQINKDNSFGFVCHFTSLSGLLGNFGQSAYAAANACIDAYTEYYNLTHNNQKNWMTINWGLWKTAGGMQMDDTGLLEPMDAIEACLAMEQAMIAGGTAVIFKGDLTLLKKEKPIRVILSEEYTYNQNKKEETDGWLRTIIYKFSHLNDFEDDVSIVELGVDSVALINIITAIENELRVFKPGLRLNKAMLFEYSSVDKLANELHNRYPVEMLALFPKVASNFNSKIDAERKKVLDSSIQNELYKSAVIWLQGIIQKYSGFNNLDEFENLLDKGIDSVTSINISTEISRQLSKNLPKAILFEYSSIHILANYFMEQFHDDLQKVLIQSKTSPISSKIDSLKESLVTVDLCKKPAPQLAKESKFISQEYRSDDVAIIGLAGEFPNADSVEELWRMLLAGDSGIIPIPESRWDWQKDYSTDRKQQTKSYGRHGGFLRRGKEFDPVFFNIAPIDAEKIDPQERRLLQMSYHALEDSGYFASPIQDVGVFVAAMFGHYQDLEHEKGAVSSSFASIANRISYSFDFHGPSFTVDSMCSGSLTALHLAANSIRQNETKLAVVGAVNMMPHSGKYKMLSSGKFLSPTGRCHAFGIEADGYVPGEGTVAVVLKRLEEAIKDKDNVYGIIRSSAINSGGRTSAFTVPSAKAQAQVIQMALNKADISADAVDYIETHGTGTSLGDPIEIEGLLKIYGQRSKKENLLLGSVKSNIGHLESAAGMAGLSKLLMQFHFNTIAPTIGCTLENPYLNLKETPFSLAKETKEWISSTPRFAALSSFGAGGSNGHLILQEYRIEKKESLPNQDNFLIPVSAKTKRALRQRLEDLKLFLSTNHTYDLYSLSYTLACCREHFSERVCYQVRSKKDLEDFITRQLESNSEVSSFIEDDYGLQEIAKEYLQGKKVNFSKLFIAKSKITLPYYPFERKEYWISMGGKSLPKTTERETSSTSSQILFSPHWKEVPLIAPTKEFSKKEPFVLFGENIPHLLLDGIQKVYVRHGEEFSIDESEIKIRPCEEEDYLQLFNHLQKRYQVERISYLYFSVGQMDWSKEAFIMSKAILKSKLHIRLLHLIPDKSDCSLLNNAVAGIFHTTVLENRNIQARTLTLIPTLFEHPAKLSEIILEELSDTWDGYSFIRRELSSRHKRQMEEEFLQPHNLRFKKSGVYVISGGMGMIGLAIAQHLISTLEATVILLGRSMLDKKKEFQLSELNKGAGAATYISVDITDLAQTKECINSILLNYSCINGLIHSAAILNDGLLQNKSWADFKQVLEVKIAGAHHLDQATADLKLDFFSLFSSMSSILGNVGQADYVMANRYLDSFAETRNRRVATGTAFGHTLSINWPLWIDNLGDTSDQMSQYTPLSNYLFKSFGIKPIRLEEGCQLFVQLINGVSSEVNQVMPLKGDLEKIRETFVEKPNLQKGKINYKKDDILINPIEIQTIIKQNLLLLVSNMTEIVVEDLEESCSWGDMGFNSVMLQNFATEVEKIFDISIPASIFFTYNTIKEFIKYLYDENCNIREHAKDSLKEIIYSSIPKEPITTDKSVSPIQGYAIIGMDGQMPGGNNLEDFWQLLIREECAIKKVERWGHKDYFAGTISGIEDFDAKFFGLSAREAMLMDPQHRIFLQTCYNTFLDAGYSPKEFTNVGVFAGVQFNDYQTLLQQWHQSNHPYAATGNAHAMLANRVSYLMNFRGPSQTIDTACSSALIALNRGIIALEKGECEFALVGAVSLLIDPVISDAAKSMGVLSPNYRCATFDAQADGYVRAEGVGCVLIKRLDKAINDGDSIYAVIDRCVENHGGKSNSLTSPSPEAQKELLIRAYNTATAKEVSYIETHGTGTVLGDPIEIDALKSAWKEMCPNKGFESIALGAVKTNIGHLEPAAGIASLLKVILAFKHKFLPANLHFSSQNPYINLTGSPFKLLKEAQPWHSSKKLVAGISSFGFGGSNAHVVLREAPNVKKQNSHDKKYYLVTLSSKSLISLDGMCQNLEKTFNLDYIEYTLSDVSFTLNRGREHFEYRLAWVVESIEQLQQKLSTVDLSIIKKVKINSNVINIGPLNPHGDDYRKQLEACRLSYLSGDLLDWNSLHANETCRRLHLPTYNFDTRAYWFENAIDSELIKELN